MTVPQIIASQCSVGIWVVNIFLAISTKADANIFVHVFWFTYLYISVPYIPKWGTVEKNVLILQM